MLPIFTTENLIQPLNDELFKLNGISVCMLRLDRIHPVVSGNKIFKLHYFLQKAINSSHKKVITFGGAYSNHLAAAAFACKQNNLKCIGIVRGEKPKRLSHTLQFCINNGMQLQLISRNDYKRISEKFFTDELIQQYGDHVLIPEGGFSKCGVDGAALIADHYKMDKKFTHVCVAVGTATTLAGLIQSGNDATTFIGFSALKNLTDIDKRFELLQISLPEKTIITNDYHFGGYAKKTSLLISFMNNFYKKHTIPLDFVYTGKMMFGVNDLIQKKYFDKGSNILCIHTGGLQGNQSLPEDMLNF